MANFECSDTEAIENSTDHKLSRVLALCMNTAALCTNGVLAVVVYNARVFQATMSAAVGSMIAATLLRTVFELVLQAKRSISLEITGNYCVIETTRLECSVWMWPSWLCFDAFVFSMLMLAVERAQFSRTLGNNLNVHASGEHSRSSRWTRVAFCWGAPWLLALFTSCHPTLYYWLFAHDLANERLTHCETALAEGYTPVGAAAVALAVLASVSSLIIFWLVIAANERFWADFGRQPQPLSVRLDIKRNLHGTKSMLYAVLLHSVATTAALLLRVTLSLADVLQQSAEQAQGQPAVDNTKRRLTRPTAVVQTVMELITAVFYPVVLIRANADLKAVFLRMIANIFNMRIRGKRRNVVDTAMGEQAMETYFEQYKF